MYIIVVGGGEVGYYLSKILLSDGHEVLILEKDAAISEKLTEELGSIVFRGDGCEAATLDGVGTARADMLVAVTGDDEDNLVACQVAKHKFNVPHTIARIKNPRNETIFKILGINATVRDLTNTDDMPPTHVIPSTASPSSTLPSLLSGLDLTARMHHLHVVHDHQINPMPGSQAAGFGAQFQRGQCGRIVDNDLGF